VNDHTYDSQGNMNYQTNPTPDQPAAVGCLFACTGKPLDKNTGLQNNVNRWYDSTVGRWISEDPIGFLAGESNTDCYVGNSPTSALDPTGLSHLPGGKKLPKIEPPPDLFSAEFWTLKGQGKLWRAIGAGSDLCVGTPIAMAKIPLTGGQKAIQEALWGIEYATKRKTALEAAYKAATAAGDFKKSAEIAESIAKANAEIVKNRTWMDLLLPGR
jgi:RHS repeat-associated protein